LAFLILLGIIVAGVLAWRIYSRRRQARRDRLLRQPLPEEYIHILEDKVPLYAILPDKLRHALHGRINIFLNEKKFIGCAGFTITDEVRLTIAGNACILLLNRANYRFTGFTSILVYPDTYVAEETTYDGVVETHGQESRAGESWHRGPVVLAWSDVVHGTLHERDGHNVVLHEFAHKLDEENTIMDGLPVLRNSADYQEWAEVLTREYDALVMKAEHHDKSVMDQYGAVSPAEFFAVATETFFEKPGEMQEKLTELYQQLNKFYGLDPATWHDKKK